MKMKFKFIFLFALLGVTVLFNSCEKDNFDLPQEEQEEPKKVLQDDALAEEVDLTLPEEDQQRFEEERNALYDQLESIRIPSPERDATELRSSVRSISGALTSIRVIKETNEWGSDEPYVITVAIHLPSVQNYIRNRNNYGPVRTTITGVWGDADSGESKYTIPIPEVHSAINQWDIWQGVMRKVVRRPFWGMTGRTQAVYHPDDVVFLVAMMEHDDTPISYFQNIVQNAMLASSINVALASNMTRSQKVARLKADMDKAIRGVRNIPVLPINNSDEQLGITQELRLSTYDIQRVGYGTITKSLYFAGDGGQYRVYFQLKNTDFFP